MPKGVQLYDNTGDKVYPCPYFPIGAIYMSLSSTNPRAFFGGTWEQIKEKFLLACSDTYKSGSTGGETDHTLSISEMPAHSHGSNGGTLGTCNYGFGREVSGLQQGGAWSDVGVGRGSPQTYNAGGGQAHNNMPPYLAVYVWKRIK